MNKKFLATLAFLTILLSIISCTSTTAVDLTAVDKHGHPLWIKTTPESEDIIYSVGYAFYSNIELSKNAATANARTKLAIKLYSYFDDLLQHSIKSQHKKNENDYYILPVDKISITLINVKTEQIWSNKKGETWAIISVDKSNIIDIYKQTLFAYKKNLTAEMTKIKNNRDNLLISLKGMDPKVAEIIAQETINQSNELIASIHTKQKQIDNTIDLLSKI